MTRSKPHPPKAARACLFALALGVSFGLVSLGGCGSNTTSVMLPLHYQNASPTLTNHTEWQITLTKATLSFGALRCLEGKPAYTWLSPFRRWERMLLTPTAVAHPGHYLPEGVKAELIFSQELDLLQHKGPMLGMLHGYTGDYGSMELEFSDLDTLVLQGQATKAAQSVAFDFSIKPGKYLVAGIPFVHKVADAVPILDLRIDLTRLFQWVEFDAFVKQGESTVPDDGANNVMRKALHSNALYKITATPPPTAAAK